MLLAWIGSKVLLCSLLAQRRWRSLRKKSDGESSISVVTRIVAAAGDRLAQDNRLCSTPAKGNEGKFM